MACLDQVEDLQPVEARALQPDVQEDEVRTPRLDGGERLVGAPRSPAAVTFVVQDAGDEVADVGLVVDDQKIGAQAASPRSGGPSARRPSPLS